MPHLGKVQEFDEASQSFETYVERFELFVAANSIKEEKKAVTFLTVIGDRAYEVLKNLAAPDLPGSKTYSEIKTLLEEHYGPQRALRDRLVAGLRDEETQKELFAFAEEKLSFAVACKIAREKEAAAKQTADMHKESKAVNAIHKKVSPPENRGHRRSTSHDHGSSTSQPSCYRCGNEHEPRECRFKTYRCKICYKTGHLRKMCRNTPGKTPERHVQVLEDSDDEDEDLLTVYTCMKSSPGFQVLVEVERVPLLMLIDTGAAVSIIPEEVFMKHFPQRELLETKVALCTYSGERLSVKGKISAKVQYNGQEETLDLFVVASEGRSPPVLLGRDWLRKLKLDWTAICSITVQDQVEQLRKKYPNVFDSSPGMVRNYQAQIVIKENSTPVFCKARPVPLPLKEAVTAQLRKLETDGILRHVSQSDWATPLVVVPKNGGESLRLCGDYKVTINPVLKMDHYPLPHPEDIFSTLVGGRVFCVLDLSSAYQQIQLSDTSKHLLTINTHLGLFEYQRLPFGVASAPAIFQPLMDRVLQGIAQTCCYIDDIIIAGRDMAECTKILDSVLQRLSESNLTLRKEKCKFFADSVVYLGHQISAQGIQPTQSKVKAITEAPEPTNVTELKAYLGMLTFYGKFLRNLADMASPLYELLKKGNHWKWDSSCKKAFQATKDLLVNSSALAYYDVDKPIGVVCDASAYGLGAVLFHKTSEGAEVPIAFTSRTLTPAGKNYAQGEREALAIIFCLKRFHRYLYGRFFTIYTDHQPLLGILSHDKAAPTLAAARMQRWALLLSGYNYRLCYRRCKDNEAADALSRLPLPRLSEDAEKECLALFDATPITAMEVSKATSVDNLLSRVLHFTLRGWPTSEHATELQPFYVRRSELSVEEGCLTWGLRVIIPKKLQSTVLSLLHEEHPGMCHMKMLARGFVWWPNLDKDIKECVRGCKVWQVVQAAAPVVPLHPWTYPQRIWQRIHIDFAIKNDVNFLIIVDAYSKWLEVFPMRSTTTAKTLEKLHMVFANFGLPEEIVSDNGPQFSSHEFAEFMKRNLIKHIRTPPYHPASNGAAKG